MVRVSRFAWATLGCNLAVVLWGAYVRATGSGAGCGNKWPICDGGASGTTATAHTIIEFTHRMTSGAALIMVVCLLVWCWRSTSRGNWARYSAALSAGLLMNEALLGGALVLLGYVAQDKSAGRVLFLGLHFGNTLLLLAALSLTAEWLSKGGDGFRLIPRARRVGVIAVGLLATMIIGITGTVAALADTLFPASSLQRSILEDFSSGAPTLLRVRLLHPAVAAIAVAYVVWVVFTTWSERDAKRAIALIFLLFLQVGIGIMNVLLMAPIWLQIVHLFVADLLWILLVLVSAERVLESASTPRARTLAEPFEQGRISAAY